MILRLALTDDIPVLAALIEQSVLNLQQNEYSLEQRQGALGTVFGVDRLLIEDGTYFVIEDEESQQVVACGGWSKRNTLFGSDHSGVKNDSWLDPNTDAARIRAFFVHPSWARRGLGSRILQRCEAEARAAGFTSLTLGATLTGVPLYARYGFEPVEQVNVGLPNGGTIPIVRMEKTLQSTSSTDRESR